MHSRFSEMIGALVLLASPAFAQPACHNYSGSEKNKPNKLYLYFPTSDDATYPEFGTAYGVPTSPAKAFNTSALTSFTGNAADLRGAITQVVKADYCELAVEVIETTTAPPNTYARRNTVAVGTDPSSDGGTFGLAQAVDSGDGTVVDFARVWAGTYQSLYGGAGGALNGANSTVQRWANSIGGTAAHEAGHNYGLSHADGLTLATGEDPLVHHLMASGSHYSGEERAGYRRHFSDHEYSVLAANIGLALQTMWNWDLINPNAETGVKLQMDFLSTKASVTRSWQYTGNLSPWQNPTVSGPSGTQVFKGTTYNKFMIEWSNGNPAWAGGVAGQILGGQQFHVGAGLTDVDFGEPDAIIITDCRIIKSDGSVLAMHPRVIGYDAGALDAATDTMNVRFFNFGAPSLVLQNVQVQELPRVLSIDAMLGSAVELKDERGRPFAPWAQTRRTVLRASRPIERNAEQAIPVSKIKRNPHVLFALNRRQCDTLDRLRGPDAAKCTTGLHSDLFPSTAVYMTATVVDPNARYWDRNQKRYVTGPLTSRLYYQIAGRRMALEKRVSAETLSRLKVELGQ